MEIIKKEVLNDIKKLINSCVLDTNEIYWFRYIMDHIKEMVIPGTSDTFYIISFNNEDCPMDHIKFRNFLEDYRRDK